jgi:predicted phosphoribosyltransferase
MASAPRVDGTVRINERMLASFGLGEEQIERQIDIAKQKVDRRIRKFQKYSPPGLSGRKAILVDDGIASGITMQTAIEAAARLRAEEIIIAVPTAHNGALEKLSTKAVTIYCANVRTGFSFAVADAYKNWIDVDEDEAAQILQRFSI